MRNVNQLLIEQGYAQRHDYVSIVRWAGANIKNFTDETALLTAVEEKFGMAGPKKKMSAAPKPYRLWSSPKLQVDADSIKQLETALSLPVAIGGAGMPDMHVGYSVPIGGVVVLDQAISPAFVGYDISCMMMLTILDAPPELGPSALAKEDVRQRYLKWVVKSTSFGLGARSWKVEHAVMDDPVWSSVNVLLRLKALAASQLGTSGAGNHFADIVSGRFSDDGSEFVALMTHSGSRGVGNKIGHHYTPIADAEAQAKNDIPKGYGWFEIGKEAGQEYLAAMQLMGRYAQANHEIIHANFLKHSGLQAVRQYANRHNFAWIDSLGRVIHRKGATPAGPGEMGIIPGSSGSESFLVRGLGNPQAWESASHGAGRNFSRTVARKNFDQRAFDKHMLRLGITHHGVAPDETVAAYKNIRHVMDVQTDLVEIAAVLQPRVVVMGGNVAADDGD